MTQFLSKVIMKFHPQKMWDFNWFNGKHNYKVYWKQTINTKDWKLLLNTLQHHNSLKVSI
jgi:hypothetical protein